ncbi:MAG: UvrD-helicase domain-containing protein [Candidatus Omnitrophota bacterium]
MPERNLQKSEESELKDAIELILNSLSKKKLVIAGPGTGKTTIFKQLLTLAPGHPKERLVLTFINNLKNDLEKDLGELAQVSTLHAYCLGLLYRYPALRGSLSHDFRCCPGLASLIAEDWKLIIGGDAPHFVSDMRTLAEDNHISFYINRGNYYNAVDFDDTVFRAYQGLSSGISAVNNYELILIDEFQDFNALEAGVIDILAEHSSILIAGDDDQALYSQLRNASWDHIRLLRNAGEYEVFPLPFCMRCPKVVVDAVNDILAKANALEKLKGRIDKPYRHFPPVKGNDSIKYPKIVQVETSVQKQNVNYMGQYIAQDISRIPENEIKTASQEGYPVALVIAAQPYRDHIVSYLENAGYYINTRRNTNTKIIRDTGLLILKEDLTSNLGWRIIIDADSPAFLRDAIAATSNNETPLVKVIPTEYREKILKEINVYEHQSDITTEEQTAPDENHLTISVTSFEGAKGLSAQHVYIAGLHRGELPHDTKLIKDLEICKFVVGLTRTRKKCTLIHTRNFAGKWKQPSCFLSWINPEKFEHIKIDAQYWKRK